MLSFFDAMYSLQAIAVHEGYRPTAGHYFAYAKDKQGKWIHVNDSAEPKVVIWEEVERQQAYLLTYQKV